MAELTTLDELDVKILRLLNADARKSYRDIAKATDASISTVSSRVRKLEDLGVITGYVPVLNEARLGYDVLVLPAENVAMKGMKTDPEGRLILPFQGMRAVKDVVVMNL